VSSLSNQPGTNERLAQAQNRLIENLRSSEKRYSDLVEHLRDVVFQLDADFKWLYLNQAWTTLSGYSLEETIENSFMDHLDCDDQVKCERGFIQLINSEIEELILQVNLKTADKSLIVMELSCRAFDNEIGEKFAIAGILSDITERVKAERKITHLAYHDALTGLANRRLLLDYINNKITACSDSINHSGLIFIDVDRFKQVNDIYGHVTGDLVLCGIADKLTKLLFSANCMLSRFAGDEFVVCIELNSPDERIARIELLEMCDLILQNVREKIVCEPVTLSVTASIGCILLDSQVMDQDVALKFADEAMYKSKRNGRNAIQFYDRHLRQEELNKRQFENEIQEAIQKQEFVLHYQPQVEIKTNRIVKVEALIRWQHPVKGIISPDKFIPYLELSGLIIEVGFWVLEESIKQLGEWIQKGVNDIGMSVNVSAHQFMRADFVENLSILLNKYAIPAHLIELELTESVAVTDIDLTIIRMKMINLLGVKIALDDFGTGYSSLAYLKHFPIDTLKIDKSFIRGLPDDGYDAAIVETTMVMSRHLGLTVVAEGVETKTQLNFLMALDCQLYQGYYCSRAMKEKLIFPLLYNNFFEHKVSHNVQY